MNSLELKNVMNVLGIERKGTTTNTRQGVSDLYSLNGLDICFGGTYYTIVRGRIPLKVAQRIYDKYPGNPYSIRVAGGRVDNKPIDWVTSDKYEKFIELVTPNNMTVMQKVVLEEIKKMFGKDPENLYVDSYHIDTKEGVLVLLTEMQDYFIRKMVNYPEANVQVARLPKLLAEVNRRLIEQGNPYKTTGEWLEERKMLETGNNPAAFEILPYLKAFDNAVNPFNNDNYEMKDPEEYVDKVSFGLYANQEEDGLRMQISSKGVSVEHARIVDNGDCYLTHALFYRIKPGVAIHIHHYISQKENANVICLSTSNNDIDLRFDLISGLAYITYAQDNEKEPITPEQTKFFIKELEKATKKAEKLTLNNMATPITPNIMGKRRQK